MLDTSREIDHTLESNTGDAQYSMIGRTNPQDYEVPAPPPSGGRVLYTEALIAYAPT